MFAYSFYHLSGTFPAVVLKLKSGTVQLYVGIEILTEVAVKYSVLWDMMLCSPLKVDQHFLRTCLPPYSASKNK
jgi:hypothetical protein